MGICVYRRYPSPSVVSRTSGAGLLVALHHPHRVHLHGQSGGAADRPCAGTKRRLHPGPSGLLPHPYHSPGHQLVDFVHGQWVSDSVALYLIEAWIHSTSTCIRFPVCLLYVEIARTKENE